MTFSTLASPGVSLQGGGGGGGGGGTPGGSNTQLQYNNAGAFAGASGLTTNGTNLTFGSASQLLWSTDLILSRRAAANLRLGAADAAAPVAQTLSVQSVVAGTTNTAGANLTITGSQGTGTGAGGSIVFQVAPAGSTGTAQNALVTFLEATSARAFNLYNTTDVTTNYERGKIAWSSNVLQIGTEKAGTGTARALEFQTDGVTRLTIASGGGLSTPNTSSGTLTVQGSFSTTTGYQFVAWNGGQIGWGSAASVSASTALDTGLKRSAAAIVAVTNGSTGGGAVEFQEMTAPTAPATNNVRIYAEDNGSGKTRLMALFPTGAAVQIAIEP